MMRGLGSLWAAAMVVVSGCMGVGPALAEPSGTTDWQEAVQFIRQAERNQNPVIANMAREMRQRMEQPAAQANAKQQVEVPLMAQSNSSLAVPAILNDGVMGTFIVDTGATYTVITPRMARKLGVVITAQTPRLSILTANGPIRAPLVTLQQVTLGGVSVRNVQAIVQDLGNDLLLAGLLGMNVFRDMDLTVKQNRLILHVSRSTEPKPVRGSV